MINDLENKIIERLDLSANLDKEQILELIDVEVQKESKINRLSILEGKSLRQKIYSSIRELGLLQELINDPEITEIMVNGTEGIFIEKHGKLFSLEENFESEEKLKQVIYQITADCNRTVNESNPIVDARLMDGSRVNVVLNPIAINGPILTIRKFPPKPIMINDLINFGSINKQCADFLEDMVKKGLNILISGGTGSGKTTLLNVLSNFILENERVITIEDSAELQLQNIKNLIRLETRNINIDGCKDITIRDLLKTSLRMRPDRIIVGEVRSVETIDMLQSINVGHSAMTTVHANSVKDVISRLETMVLMGMDMPLKAIRNQIVSGFDLMIHVGRFGDGKRGILQIAQPVNIVDGEVYFNMLFQRINGQLKKIGEYKDE